MSLTVFVPLDLKCLTVCVNIALQATTSKILVLNCVWINVRYIAPVHREALPLQIANVMQDILVLQQIINARRAQWGLTKQTVVLTTVLRVLVMLPLLPWQVLTPITARAILVFLLVMPAERHFQKSVFVLSVLSIIMVRP